MAGRYRPAGEQALVPDLPCNVGFVNRLRPAKTAVPVAAAAILGNAFIGRDSMAWFSALRRPRMQLPMSGFYVVGAAYYVLMGLVLHRALIRCDLRAYRLAMVVLASNEIWNALLFGRRSTRDAFLGILAFLVPLGLLQAAVAKDRPSRTAVGSYVAWVVCYDIPWTYRLWRLNAEAD